MKKHGLIIILILLAQKASVAQDADTTVFSIKIRKPAKVTTTGEYRAPWNYKRGSFTDTARHDTLPVLEVDIVYPAEVKELGVSGVVYVSYQYGGNGRTKNVFLEKGVHPALNDAALKYVRKMDKERMPQSPRTIPRNNSLGVIPKLYVVAREEKFYIIPIKFSLN